MVDNGISMKDYVDLGFTELRRFQDAEREHTQQLIKTIDEKNAESVRIALESLKESTKVAKAEADAAIIKHNGLIEMMRSMMGKFVSRETVMSFVAGAGIFAGIYFGFIG